MLMFDKGVALLRRVSDEGSQWLLRWNPSRECSELVEADRLSGETYRDALYREIDWQLGLNRKKDYLMSSVPRLHFELSPCGRVHPPQTFTIEANNFGKLELYAVEVYRDATLQHLASDDRNCWSRPVEIMSGVDGMGRAIRQDQFQWLQQSEALGR